MPILDTIFTRKYKMSQDRLKICGECEHFEPKRQNRCLKCRCFMNFKTLLPSAECPIKKWGKINTDDIVLTEE
jgi:hypothetical protein